MEIIYRNGDLLEQDDIDVITHSCNCQCSFGAGLAKAIRIKFPDAYKADLTTIKGDKSKMGTFSITTKTKPIVANLYSQFHYYPRGIQHTNYKAMISALDSLGIYMTNNNLKSLGLPYGMGSVLGGGKWFEVEGIIKNFAERYPNIQVYIVKL